MEARVKETQLSGGAMKRTFQRTIKPGAAGKEAFAGFGQTLPGIMAQDRRAKFCHLKLELAQSIGCCCFQSERKIVSSLLKTVEQHSHA
jgi:hypothetical protein